MLAATVAGLADRQLSTIQPTLTFLTGMLAATVAGLAGHAAVHNSAYTHLSHRHARCQCGRPGRTGSCPQYSLHSPFSQACSLPVWQDWQDMQLSIMQSTLTFLTGMLAAGVAGLAGQATVNNAAYTHLSHRHARSHCGRPGRTGNCPQYSQHSPFSQACSQPLWQAWQDRQLSTIQPTLTFLTGMLAATVVGLAGQTTVHNTAYTHLSHRHARCHCGRTGRTCNCQ